ncbi:MoaB/Mog domain-containing protein [Catenaria anguillulae PL171]|uniref:MoaB/Mog domain-containing protein n=1 Tax=Catenaria anguillulae PL171 TaxID=765915 RepID=A0A1Y2HT66_9FUNG|nr:MoaB/Mog domain-containing protein [Catenaria anguillulae PL171]
MSTLPRPKTAAACIIGDEILSGKTTDTNSTFLAKSLFALGIDLRRIEVIPDDEPDMIATIQRMSAKYDYVFTTGGIGPTHDDITYPAFAKAFDDTLVLHEETLRLMASVSPHMVSRRALVQGETVDRATSTLVDGHVVSTTLARLRMAQLPSRSRVVFTPGLWVPLCIVNNNVHILPGVPRLFRAMLNHYLPALAKDAGVPFVRRSVGTMTPEGDLAEALTLIQNAYGAQGIKIGSYPTFGNPEKERKERVNVTVVGRDKALVEKVAEEVAKAVGGWVHQVEEDGKSDQEAEGIVKRQSAL